MRITKKELLKYGDQLQVTRVYFNMNKLVAGLPHTQKNKTGSKQQLCGWIKKKFKYEGKLVERWIAVCIRISKKEVDEIQVESELARREGRKPKYRS